MCNNTLAYWLFLGRVIERPFNVFFSRQKTILFEPLTHPIVLSSVASILSFSPSRFYPSFHPIVAGGGGGGSKRVQSVGLALLLLADHPLVARSRKTRGKWQPTTLHRRRGDLFFPSFGRLFAHPIKLLKLNRPEAILGSGFRSGSLEDDFVE